MKKDPQSALAASFGFPDYYGKNLDAFHDCLTDISDPTEVFLVQWEQMGEYGRKIQQVLTDTADENDNLKVYSTYELKPFKY